MAVIYKAINKVNGKGYIGIASNFYSRQRSHFFYAFNDKGEDKKDYPLYRAMRKYGWNNFEWKILKEDATVVDEIQFIREHNTYINDGYGYNQTYGGEATTGYIYTDEQRKNISNSLIGRIPWNKGKEWSDDIKRKISLANTGKRRTEEQKDKLSKIRKGIPWSEKRRAKGNISNIGRKRTPEQIERIRLGALNRKKK